MYIEKLLHKHAVQVDCRLAEVECLVANWLESPPVEYVVRGTGRALITRFLRSSRRRCSSSTARRRSNSSCVSLFCSSFSRSIVSNSLLRAARLSLRK